MESALTELPLSRRSFLLGTEGPLFLWPLGHREENDLPELRQKLEGLLPGAVCSVLAFESNWDNDLSPWPAELPDGSRFSGKGAETLRFLAEEALPAAGEKGLGQSGKYLMGYSLAGLFALWGFAESCLFDGALCCSGSLWFPGWDEYADAHPLPEGGRLYLSLGGKEPGRGKPPMSSIGEAYERQNKRCKKSALAAFTLEMNPGGHFSDPTLRMAKGMAWMLRQASRASGK